MGFLAAIARKKNYIMDEIDYFNAVLIDIFDI